MFLSEFEFSYKISCAKSYAITTSSGICFRFVHVFLWHHAFGRVSLAPDIWYDNDRLIDLKKHISSFMSNVFFFFDSWKRTFAYAFYWLATWISCHEFEYMVQAKFGFVSSYFEVLVFYAFENKMKFIVLSLNMCLMSYKDGNTNWVAVVMKTLQRYTKINEFWVQ